MLRKSYVCVFVNCAYSNKFVCLRNNLIIVTGTTGHNFENDSVSAKN